MIPVQKKPELLVSRFDAHFLIQAQPDGNERRIYTDGSRCPNAGFLIQSVDAPPQGSYSHTCASSAGHTNKTLLHLWIMRDCLQPRDVRGEIRQFWKLPEDTYSLMRALSCSIYWRRLITAFASWRAQLLIWRGLVRLAEALQYGPKLMIGKCKYDHYDSCFTLTF